MTNARLNLFMMWMIPLIFTVIGPLEVVDVAGWIAHGNYFLDHHEILRHDIFSILPTRPLVYPSWGISILYALINRLGGLTSVCLFHSVLLIGLLALIYRHSILSLKNPGQLFTRLSVYFVWLGAVNALGERPSMVALLPLTLAYLEIARIEKISDVTPKLILKLILISVVWVNIHGSFILLELMFAWKSVFLIWSERRLARLFSANAALFLSTLINPFTFQVYPYLWETMKSSQARTVPEWAPTQPFEYFPTGFLFFVLLFVMSVHVIRRIRQPGFAAFISSPFFPLLLNGFSAVRNAAIPFVVLLPFMTKNGLLETAGSLEEKKEPRSINLLSAALFVLIFILILPPLKPIIANFLPPDRRKVFSNTSIPLITDEILKTGRNCPIFNAPDLGSFLMLKLANPIFLDSRNIIYSDQEFRDYAATSQAQPGWEAYLDRYHACFAVLDMETSAPLITAMKETGGKWAEILEEKGSVLFEKRP